MDCQQFDYRFMNIPIPSVKQIQFEFLNSIHMVRLRQNIRKPFQEVYMDMTQVLHLVVSGC